MLIKYYTWGNHIDEIFKIWSSEGNIVTSWYLQNAIEINNSFKFWNFTGSVLLSTLYQEITQISRIWKDPILEELMLKQLFLVAMMNYCMKYRNNPFVV